VNGKTVSKEEVEKIPVEKIESMNVIKDKSNPGDKGTVEITLKKE